MSGYEVCQKIKENLSTEMLPVVMVTALDPVRERVNGLNSGADDFLTKPINQAELLARVRSLLRIKELYETIHAQAGQLSEWNKTLEQRAQRIAFFVCRETTTNKNIFPQKAKTFAQSSSPDWAKLLTFAYSASLRLDS